MKKVLFIVALLALAACGGRGEKKPVKTTAGHYTVEDTVRLQLDGELFYIDPIDPMDSITVIHRRYGRMGYGLYREYGFIVHSRDRQAHRTFEIPSLDASYSQGKEVGYYSDADSVQAEYLDPAIGSFNGYWIPLKEYGGDYYLDGYRGDLGTFHIADSIVTFAGMDGLYAFKIQRAHALPDEGIVIEYDKAPERMEMELLDREREIYRIDYGGRDVFFTPARAIRHFEVIEWVNSSGDLINNERLWRTGDKIQVPEIRHSTTARTEDATIEHGDKTGKTYRGYEFGDRESLIRTLRKEELARLTTDDSIYTTHIRPGEKLSLGRVYTDHFEYLDYSDEGDDLSITVIKEEKIYTFIANPLWQAVVADRQFHAGERLEIAWKIDFMSPAGDDEIVWVVKMAEKITTLTTKE